MNVNIPYLQMTKRKNEQSCFKSRLEMVRLVRFRTVSDKFLYMTGKRIKFLIDMYGSWRLTVPWLWRIPPVYDLFWCLFGFLLFLVFCFFSFFFFGVVFLAWFQLRRRRCRCFLLLLLSQSLVGGETKTPTADRCYRSIETSSSDQDDHACCWEKCSHFRSLVHVLVVTERVLKSSGLTKMRRRARWKHK